MIPEHLVKVGKFFRVESADFLRSLYHRQTSNIGDWANRMDAGSDAIQRKIKSSLSGSRLLQLDPREHTLQVPGVMLILSQWARTWRQRLYSHMQIAMPNHPPETPRRYKTLDMPKIITALRSFHLHRASSYGWSHAQSPLSRR